MNKTSAFLYKWIELSTKKWYVGSHYAEGCHVEDGYICSSKTVKPMILENRNNWIRNILVIGDPKYIVELETDYLKLLDAKNDPMSYNGHNGDGKFSGLVNRGRIPSLESNAKRSAKLKDRALSPESNAKRSKTRRTRIAAGLIVPWNKGALLTAEQKQNYNKPKGPQSAEHSANIAKGMLGKNTETKIKIICPHCNKIVGGQANFNRWHGDNCKLNIKHERK